MPNDTRIEEAPAKDREMLLRILAFSKTTDPRLVLAVLRTGKKPPEKMTDPQLRAAVKVAVLTVKSDVAGAVGKAREQGLMKKVASPEKIPGGLAKGRKPSDFDPTALAKGRKVELEHTSDPSFADEIAMDHLTEDPKYYDKLEKLEKMAAKVGTDTASVWAIAPENLARLLKDKTWAKTFHETYVAREPKEGAHARLDIGVREHGGAVFHTGGDGIYDVRVVTEEGEMPVVKEMGYLPPYGTKDYKLASEWPVTIGNVSLDARPHPDGHWFYAVHDGRNYKRLASDLDNAPQHGPWKVDAAKLRQLAPKIADALAKEIAKLGVPTDALKKTTWFRDLPVPQAKRDKLDGIVWIKGKALFPEDDSEVLWDMFRETASAANKILLDKKVIGPLAE